MVFVELVLGFALKVPVHDGVVAPDTHDVFLGWAQGHIQDILSMAFEQFWTDFWHQVQFAVLVFCLDVTYFDGAYESVPTCREYKAAVIGQVEVLDEVTVLALTLEQFAVVL